MCLKPDFAHLNEGQRRDRILYTSCCFATENLLQLFSVKFQWRANRGTILLINQGSLEQTKRDLMDDLVDYALNRQSPQRHQAASAVAIQSVSTATGH